LGFLAFLLESWAVQKIQPLSINPRAAFFISVLWFLTTVAPAGSAADLQSQERTCFQTGQPWSGAGNLRSDVAIAYGIAPGISNRIQSWREHGYRVHVMTGVAWGQYQDYLYGRFDGINHEDEAQTDRAGNKISHGGDVYYMSPGTNYGKFLCVGVQRALDAGVEAIHLEEPEFWIRGGYSEGFKREWRAYYGEDWQPPHSSVDARWRASKLMYFLYRRALQQVFDYVQHYNHRSGRHVRCYVPTHSLLNYAQWAIVSPESSLARLEGCDGYIAQVWTGTSRTPNFYRGVRRERTFETAFLEYGAMQNLVRSTGRRVWYLNDPVEDNANHDWLDYQRNWESTLVASLFQPEVWRYEVAPWPERVFAGRYPRRAPRTERQGIPPEYATELQTVMNALNDMQQTRVEWDCGSSGVGVLISDSLMFQRDEPQPADANLGHIYGMAMPLLKRGMPIAPVQLENVTIAKYLDPFKVLFLTYEGMKPLSGEVHTALAGWVKHGGSLIVVDDDADQYNTAREWWNTGTNHFATPREHLFQQLAVKEKAFTNEATCMKAGKGAVFWLRKNPYTLSISPEGDVPIVQSAQKAASQAGLKWRETNYLLLRRGPYLIGAGLDESSAGPSRTLPGRFVSLFDPQLIIRTNITLSAGSRHFLLDLDAVRGKSPQLLASACNALTFIGSSNSISVKVEGVENTSAILLLQATAAPRTVSLEGKMLSDFEYSAREQLVWVRFQNEARPRNLQIEF